MKINVKKWISLTAMLLSLLMLTACAAGQVLDDIEEHLEAELALSQETAIPVSVEVDTDASAEPEESVSDEPSDEVSDSASEEAALATADEASIEDDASEEPSSEEPSSEEPSSEEPAQESDTEETDDVSAENNANTEEAPAESEGEDMGTVVKNILTDRNEVIVFHQHGRNKAVEATHITLPSRDKAFFIIPDYESAAVPFHVSPKLILFLSHGSAAL